MMPPLPAACRAGNVLLLITGALCLASSSGCAVVMAARAPEKKDLSVLTPGTPRSMVVSELGAPLHSTDKPEGVVDVFAFKQGYSSPVRFSRAVFHGVADVFTWGLWEAAGTPLEGVMQGEEVRAEVRYTPDHYVNRVQYFSGAHLAHGGPTLSSWMRGKGTVQTAVIEAPRAAPEGAIMQAAGRVAVESQ